MQPTSLESYVSIVSQLGNRQLEVLNMLAHVGQATNRELSNAMEAQINTITPRTNELVKMGIVKEAERRPCTISGRTSIVWEIVKLK